MKYVYTAVFTKLDDGGYSVSVPDLAGCITGGDNLTKAIEMLEDAAAMWLWDSEINKETIPPATPFEEIVVDKDQIKSMILLDTDEYRRLHENKAVKKTLTIPSWLNAQAEQAGINFSQILQDGLKERLRV